jgi:hypothetical protein
MKYLISTEFVLQTALINCENQYLKKYMGIQLKLILLFVSFLILCSHISVAQHSGNNKKNANKLVHPKTKNKAQASYYQLLKSWCDALLELQVKTGDDEGGIMSPASKFCLGRSGEMVYAFMGMYEYTGDVKYKTAALKVYQWSEKHVSQPDGSWTNEIITRNDWKGITVFRCVALGEAIHYYGHLLTATEKQQWTERLRKGADYILASINFETGDINYSNSAAAALAICWRVLGDEKYKTRAKGFANFGVQHLTVNNLMWGEGVRGPNDTTAKGLRPIDVPYNIEESLPNLALYATITSDKAVLEKILPSFQAHLNFILPDGGMDAGWCSRQYKWMYYGSTTADGIIAGMALLANKDKRFLEAAHRNLALIKNYTHNGLIYGGADYISRGILPSSHHTIGNTKGLLTAIHANVKQGKKAVLPNDTAYGVREWKEASVIQIGIGPWRASVTTNDIASSKKRGGHPMGGALSLLWHKKTGPIAVASMNDYVRYEGSNMQIPISDDDKFCLTPRIEVVKDKIIYSNLYDGKASMDWVKKGDTVYVLIKGKLTNVDGLVLANEEAAFTITYTFAPTSFTMAVHATTNDAKLIFPVVSPASEKVSANDKGKVVVQKKYSAIEFTTTEQQNFETISTKRVFNFIPGFEALPLQIKLDKDGNATVKVEVSN